MTATVAGMNLQRLDDWLTDNGSMGTRVSSFAQLGMVA